MKQLRLISGGYPFYADDLATMQEEIYKAIENQYLNSGGIVFSGCEVSGSNISAGLVFLDGKTREVAAAGSLTFPSYIIPIGPTNTDNRVFLEDLTNKATKTTWGTQIVTSLPGSGDFITITASGCNKRLSVLTSSSSYVSAKKTSNQTINTGNNFVDFDTVTDKLSEFVKTTGVFTAQETGIYQVNFSARVDYNSPDGIEVVAEFSTDGGSTWTVFGADTRNVTGIQGTVAVNQAIELQATQKIRARAVVLTATSLTLQNSFLSIVKIR